MERGLLPERLLAIIETQNEIAATAPDVDAVMALVVERARILTGADASGIELADGEEIVYHLGSGAAADHIGLRQRIDSSLSGRCVREGTTLHCHDARSDDRVDVEACRRVGAVSIVCAPLNHAGRVVGVLEVYDRRANAFGAVDVTTLDLLSGVIATQMAHASDSEARSYASVHDSLTGLPNRRALDERLATELYRARRYGGPLSVCLADIDRFKLLNGTRGHAAGDAVLRAVATNLSRLRGEDAAYRLAGDDFALVLVGACPIGAATVMRRLAETIALDPLCQGVRVSWGAATFERHDDAGSMLARAEAALDGAKRASAAE